MHPKTLEDGTRVNTPLIIDICGRVVTTLELHRHWIVLGTPRPPSTSKPSRNFDPEDPLKEIQRRVRHRQNIEELGSPPPGLNTLLANARAASGALGELSHNHNADQTMDTRTTWSFVVS